jgi:aspartyl-tRNA(Asn)/glutamyl-tRNA(Gln) amidotransferase subunit A
MMAAADLRSLADVARLVQRGHVSPVDLVRSCLSRIEARRELNAFITVMDDAALADAAAAEREIAAGHYRGPLHGIPVSLKDLIDVAGTPTTSGSAVPPRLPARDAPIVERLRRAGAVIIGKTNLHEFAFGTTGDESAFGAVKNPFDVTRSAGGSSSGAAVALVEGMCFAALGTDTGGSIRIPAAACGVVGLKPAYGELSCEGIVPLSATCDHVGPLTRTVGDARRVYDALSDAARPPARPARVALGVPGGYLLERLDEEVRAALGRVSVAILEAGHTILDVEIEHAPLTPDVYLHIVLPEAARYHAATLAAYPEAYSPGVRLRLEMGGYVLAEDYVRAMQTREKLRASVDLALERCDALLLPALAIPAPLLGATSVDIEGRPEPVRAAMLRLTQLFNLSGHPAIALPCGRTSTGLPIGMQLVGRSSGTADLLDVAEALEDQIVGGAGSVGGGTR